jgi:hypothetical protein
MSCNNINYLEYYPGDNNEITVDIAYSDGTSIDNLQQDLTNAIFQAQDSTGNAVLTLQRTDDPARISYASVQGKDRLTITPLVADMAIDVGEYDIYLKIILEDPDRNHHVQMFKDGVQLTKLKILAGGIA